MILQAGTDFHPPERVVQVSFEIADIMTCELPPNSFDVIYSRDTILHIKDKAVLFRRCFTPLVNTFFPCLPHTLIVDVVNRFWLLCAYPVQFADQEFLSLKACTG